MIWSAGLSQLSQMLAVPVMQLNEKRAQNEIWPIFHVQVFHRSRGLH